MQLDSTIYVRIVDTITRLISDRIGLDRAVVVVVVVVVVAIDGDCDKNEQDGRKTCMKKC